MKALVVLDTEDFLSDTAPDAQLWWAEELNRRHIKASFQMVGEMARKLKRLNRYDTINAIKKHDIGYHSNYHSVHPTTVEGNVGKNLSEAIDWTLNRDETGLSIVRELFGQPFSYTTPGTSWTAAALLAYGMNGIKMSFVNPYSIKYRPYWYCGQLIVDYLIGFDPSFPPQADLNSYYKRLEDTIQKAKDANGVFVIYTHPGRIYTAQHWDLVYAKGANPEIASAAMPPKWPNGHVNIVKERVKKILDFLQNHRDIEFSSVRSVYEEFSQNKYDLEAVLKSEKLTLSEIKKLPLKPRPVNNPFGVEPIRPAYSRWVPHTDDFQPENVYQQLEGLAYTTRLA